jgi:WD40 repeat protein
MPAGVPSNALYSVTWSPDCSLLAASSAGGAVYLFDYAKGVVLKNWQLHSKPSLRVSIAVVLAS